MTSEDEYRSLAIEQRHVDGDLEVDADARVSLSDSGAYVQCWVWVDAPETEDRKDL